MTDDLLDPYQPGASWLHRAPAWLKLALTLATVLTLVALPHGSSYGYAAVALGLTAAVALSRVSVRALLARMLLLEPFVLSVAVLTLLQPDGTTVFLGILCKSTLSLLCLLLLATTTRFTEIVAVLRRAGVPPLLTATLLLMSRYLFLLGDEQQRMRRARRARTLARGSAAAWRGSGQLIALLFVRASERGERVHAAMRARGWRP